MTRMLSAASSLARQVVKTCIPALVINAALAGMPAIECIICTVPILTNIATTLFLHLSYSRWVTKKVPFKLIWIYL